MSVYGKIQQLEADVLQFRRLLLSWKFRSGCWCYKGIWQVQLYGHDERCLQIQAALEATDYAEK